MIKVKRIIILLLVTIFPCVLFFSCGMDTGSAGEENEMKVKMIAPAKSEDIVVANKNVFDWYTSYLPCYVGENYGKGDIFYGQTIKFSWDTDIKCDYYVVDIYTDGHYKKEESFRTAEKEIDVPDLYVDSDYRWTVTGFRGGKEQFKGESFFKTQKSPRTIRIDGVSNTRDIGFFSKKIKQGMVYRSASLDEVTAKGIQDAIYSYGIKTDIDLRNSGEGSAGTSSPLGKNVNYYSLPGAYYVKSAANVKDPIYQKNMAETIKIFADEGNYPIIFHCAIGRDRTGTLAAILEAFLGASYNDILADYELSFFSEAGCRDGASDEAMHVRINELYSFLGNYGDGKVSENTEKYLLDIGVSPEDLSAIKRIMKK